MSKSSPIIGKKIKAMTDGGWELTGTVTHDKNDRILLKTESDEVLLVFKKKISAILLLSQVSLMKEESSEKNINDNASNNNFVLFKPAKQEKKKSAPVKSDEDLSEGGISLPHEVLISVPSQKNFRGSDDDDFSISMTSLFGNGRISVTSDDESK
jgi:sRNA-binding regulator protein Hfq